jgi:hypothetical protein
MIGEGRLIKVGCPYCAGHVEFSPDAVGAVVSCPHRCKSITLSDGSPGYAPPTLSARMPIASQPSRKPSRALTKVLFVVAAVLALCFTYWKAWNFFAYASVPPGGGWVQDPQAHIDAITISALVATLIIIFLICVGVIVVYKAWQIIGGWLGEK